MAADSPKDILTFPRCEDRKVLEPHLPPRNGPPDTCDRAFATLTFATSLDSSLSLSPGVRTQLSGPQSKAMTHYLRSRHDAILIGVGTAVADDPGLNCRLEGVGGYGGEGLEGQPRPVVIDPTARWGFSENSKVLVLVKQGRGRAPYIVTGLQDPPAKKRELLESYGGKYITLNVTTTDSGSHRLDWGELFKSIKGEGLDSVMIEGGGAVINSLLETTYHALVDSVIVTIAPTWLGQGGVLVSPPRQFDKNGHPVSAARLKGVSWLPLGEDVVLCGKLTI